MMSNFLKITPEEEIITRTILRGTCPICDSENIVALDDYETDETGICEHYYGYEFTDDDQFEMLFEQKKEEK